MIDWNQIEYDVAHGEYTAMQLFTKLRAALSIPAAEDGMVLVPREPTKAMIDAAIAEHADNELSSYQSIYRAMIAAAPSSTKEGV